ncbi:MAG TPA: isochorismatase family protein, partial [Acidimicrobiales bacterium]|nr:isochorismatase family protein [Acidimicrobiales bacterium]
PARRPQGGAARPPQRGPDRGRGWLAADVEIGAGATSAFYASALDDVLRSGGRTDLVVAGWGLEGPVHSTVRAANDRGYECLLVADASIATDPRLAVASCEMVRHSGGIFGAFAQTGDVLDALGGTTRTRSGR